MDNRYPLLSKFLKWKYKKKIEKMRRQYFAAQHGAAALKKFKSCLLLYKVDGN
jgi:hypothetical protein